MKCQKLFTIIVLGAILATQPMPLFACDHSSQSDGGESSSDSNDSQGTNGADSGNSDSTANSSQDSAQRADSSGDANGPSNFQLIDCSNPIFSDFLPCFERMVKERESYISIP